MERERRGSSRHGRQAGFTLAELVIVVGIIVVMSAIALPAIGRWIRNYKIRGAADQVAAEIQQAKLLAVKKNVNFGVVFVVLTETTYQYFMEDVPLKGQAQDYADSQQGTIRTLPPGVIFTPGVGTNDAGFRFNRLGAMCDPDTGLVTCPDLADSNITPAPTGNFVSVVTANPDPSLNGARIAFSEPASGLTMALMVTPGGRVAVLNR
jgi:prepilin-type N-terminal cleavage/methylation domain-containing protein